MRIRNVIYPFYDQVLEMRAWKALAVLRSRLRQSVNFEGFFLPITMSYVTQICAVK